MEDNPYEAPPDATEPLPDRPSVWPWTIAGVGIALAAAGIAEMAFSGRLEGDAVVYLGAVMSGGLLGHTVGKVLLGRYLFRSVARRRQEMLAELKESRRRL